jgi:hypothetical protein
MYLNKMPNVRQMCPYVLLHAPKPKILDMHIPHTQIFNFFLRHTSKTQSKRCCKNNTNLIPKGVQHKQRGRN